MPGFYLYWYPGPSSLQGCKKCLFLCLGGPHLPKCRPMWEVISLRTSIYYLHQYSKRPAHTIHLTVLFMAPISGLSYFWVVNTASSPPARMTGRKDGEAKEGKLLRIRVVLRRQPRVQGLDHCTWESKDRGGASSPLSLSNNSRQGISLASPHLGQMGLRVGSPEHGGRKGHSPLSKLYWQIGKKKKKSLVPFTSQRKNYGLFWAVPRWHQNPAHGGLSLAVEPSATDAGFGLFTYAASNLSATNCFIPRPISPRVQYLHQPRRFSKGGNLYSSGTRHQTETLKTFPLWGF